MTMSAWCDNWKSNYASWFSSENAHNGGSTISNFKIQTSQLPPLRAGSCTNDLSELEAESELEKYTKNILQFNLEEVGGWNSGKILRGQNDVLMSTSFC